MGVFTFLCRGSGDGWTAKQLNGELEASTTYTFELQHKLIQAALSADSSAIKSSFSYVIPKSVVFQEELDFYKLPSSVSISLVDFKFQDI